MQKSTIAIFFILNSDLPPQPPRTTLGRSRVAVYSYNICSNTSDFQRKRTVEKIFGRTRIGKSLLSAKTEKE